MFLESTTTVTGPVSQGLYSGTADANNSTGTVVTNVVTVILSRTPGLVYQIVIHGDPLNITSTYSTY
jgi:hypothetical protein